jgi:ADP-ribosylglycohydrolase
MPVLRYRRGDLVRPFFLSAIPERIMPTSHAERLERARCSLEGLSIGDAFGQNMFVPLPILTHFLESRKLPAAPWYFTDDTNMALSIFYSLRKFAGIDQDRLAHSFADHYDRSRGYGMAMRSLLPAMRQGASWRALAPSLYGRQGSYGNGSAMRVSLVGAYFADDLDAAVEHARRSAQVTHTHPEAAAGAIAVAVAAALAWRLRGSSPRPSRAQFLSQLVPLVPPGKVRDGISRAMDLPPGTPVENAVAVLGNGSRVMAQDTVPFTLWCAGEQLDHYENAIWLTLSGQGDVDTTCAIVGGIVVMSTGVDGLPAAWRSSREALPDWPFEDSSANL